MDIKTKFNMGDKIIVNNDKAPATVTKRTVSGIGIVKGIRVDITEANFPSIIYKVDFNHIGGTNTTKHLREWELKKYENPNI